MCFWEYDLTFIVARYSKSKFFIRRFTMNYSQFKDNDFMVSSLTRGTFAEKTCVAVAIKSDGVAVRNSNDNSKNTVYFTPDEWKAFIGGVRNGEFDI